MKVIKDWPPNLDEIVKKFGPINPLTVFTYGEILYSPLGGFVDSYLMTHEETHQKQQGSDPAAWWEKYIADDQFRLSQELEAYRNQYQHCCRNKKDLRKQRIFLEKIAADLSGEMYGNVISLEEALKLIPHANN